MARICRFTFNLSQLAIVLTISGILQFCQISYASAEEPGFFARLFGQKDEQETATPVPDPTSYTVSIEVPENKDLVSKLEAASNLKEHVKTLPSGGSGLVRRALSDEDRLIKALSALGYYGANVSITVAGVDVRSSIAIQRAEMERLRGTAIPVKIVVKPGQLFKINTVRILAEGKVGDIPLPAQDEIGLPIGAEARSAPVLAAERKIVDYARNKGFAFAKVVKREVVVDHASALMDISFRVRLGKRAHFAQTVVTGANNLPGFVEKRIPWNPGDEFSPEEEARLRKDLQKYDVFQSIRIREEDGDEATGAVPITVEVKERAPRFVGFGAKYSTTDGAALNAYWGHRNLFGGAERLRLDAQVSGVNLDQPENGKKLSLTDQMGYRFAATFTKPALFSIKDEFVVTPAYVREVTQNYTREGFLGAASLKYQFNDRLSGEVGLDVERAKFSRFAPDSYRGSDWYTLVGIPVTLKYDTTTDLLDPKQGYKISGTVEPFSSALGSSTDMTLFKANASAYYPIDEAQRYVLAGRVGFGSIVGADLLDIPPPRRFFAGGGGSVRGYDYQSLGPQNTQGDVIGGRSLFEASAELRMKVTDTIGIVPFFDMGGAFESSYPDFKNSIRYSAGIGLRYYTAIGPIRVDLARGLNRQEGDPQFGLYISVGQAF